MVEFLVAHRKRIWIGVLSSKLCDIYSFIYIIKRDMFVSVCMLPMAGRTAGPIKTKLGIGTHVDPRSVLVNVKVKVI